MGVVSGVCNAKNPKQEIIATLISEKHLDLIKIGIDNQVQIKGTKRDLAKLRHGRVTSTGLG